MSNAWKRLVARSFRRLLGSTRVKLFVRAVATGDELAYLGEVHGALCRLSQQALLIAIVGGQEKKTLTVASNYSVLVQRLGFFACLGAVGHLFSEGNSMYMHV